MMSPILADRLKVTRKMKDLTLKQVSEGTEINYNTIAVYECVGSISEERLKILCDFYGISVEEMKDGIEFIPPKKPGMKKGQKKKREKYWWEEFDS